MAGGDLSDFENTMGTPSSPSPPLEGGGDLKSLEAAMGHKSPAEATAPTPAPAGTPHDTFGEVARGAAKNFLPDLYNTGADIIHSVAHPIDTAKALARVGTGLYSKANGAFGETQDPAQKAKDEAAANAVGHDYANAYGSWDKFKNTVATHPVRPLMDLSSLAGIGEATLPAKAASVAGKVARYADPIQVATRAASHVASVPQSILTGTPRMAFGNAIKAASGLAEDSPEARAAFVSHYSGNAPANLLPMTIKAAGDKIKDNIWTKYKADKSNIFANAPNAVDMTKAQQAVAAAKARLASLPPSYGAADIRPAVDHAEQLVDAWAHPQSPHLRTMENVDKLRDELGQIFESNGRLNEHIKPIYGAVRDSMADVDPRIAAKLSEAQDLRGQIKDIMMTAGANPSLANSSALIKQLRLMRTAKGQDVLSRLAEVDPKIPYMLAGKALHPYVPESGLIRGFEQFAGGYGALELIKNPALWPLIAKGAAGTLAATSPKVAGGLQYGLNRAVHSPLEKAAYYGGRNDSGQTQEPPSNGVPSNSAVNMQLPRNARNNNFGNIKDGNFAKSMPGYVGSDGTFARFDTPENGAAASKRLIRNYIRMGRDTPDKIADNWVKGGENTDEDRANHAAAIADALGINHDSKIAMNDEVVGRIFHAIARREGSDVPEPEGETSRDKRARGGKVKIDHAGEAATLIRRAERAKNSLGKTTEPLLNVPDEHIAKALAVANESI